MADSVSPNWGMLSENNPQFNQIQTESQVADLGLQKQRAAYSALQGIDLGDPTAIQNAVNNSIKAGDLQQATALMGVGRQAAMYNYANQMLANKNGGNASALNGVIQAPPLPVAPQATQQGQAISPQGEQDLQGLGIAEPAAPVGMDYNGQQIDPVAATSHMDKINSEIDKAKAITDPNARLAYAQNIAGDLGIDPAQITSENLTDDKLDALSINVGAHKAAINDTAVSPKHLLSPHDMEMFALMGTDPVKDSIAVQKLQQEGIVPTEVPGLYYSKNTNEYVKAPGDIRGQVVAQKGAEAGAVAEAQAKVADPRESVKVDMPDGSTRQMSRQAFMDLQKLNIPGVGQSQTPGDKAEAEAAGKTKGENENTLGDIVVHDETTGQDRTFTGTKADLIKQLGSGQITQDSGGRYVVGKHATAQEVATTADDTKEMGKIRANASDQTKYTQTESSLDNAKTAVAALNSLKTNDLTPAVARLAGALNAIGVKAGTKEATDIATYKNLIANNTMSYIHQFPGRFTDRDAVISQTAGAGLTTPTDTAKFAFSKKAAELQREKDFNDFVIQHPELQSAKEAVKMFNGGEGQYSVYAQPIFQQTTISGNGGHPIVTPFPAEKDGSQYGVLRLNSDKKTWQKIRLK